MNYTRILVVGVLAITALSSVGLYVGASIEGIMALAGIPASLITFALGREQRNKTRDKR